MKILVARRHRLRLNFVSIAKQILVTALVCFLCSILLRANFWLLFVVAEVIFIVNVFILNKNNKVNKYVRRQKNEDVIDVNDYTHKS